MSNEMQHRKWPTRVHASMNLSTIVRVECQSTIHTDWVCTSLYFLNGDDEIVFETKLFGEHGSNLAAEDMIKIMHSRASVFQTAH